MVGLVERHNEQREVDSVRQADLKKLNLQIQICRCVDIMDGVSFAFSLPEVNFC